MQEEVEGFGVRVAVIETTLRDCADSVLCRGVGVKGIHQEAQNRDSGEAVCPAGARLNPG